MKSLFKSLMYRSLVFQLILLLGKIIETLWCWTQQEELCHWGTPLVVISCYAYALLTGHHEMTSFALLCLACHHVVPHHIPQTGQLTDDTPENGAKEYSSSFKLSLSGVGPSHEGLPWISPRLFLQLSAVQKVPLYSWINLIPIALL